MELFVGVVFTGVVIVLALWGLVGYPIWNVWASRMRGQAELQEARNEQQIVTVDDLKAWLRGKRVVVDALTSGISMTARDAFIYELLQEIEDAEKDG